METLSHIVVKVVNWITIDINWFEFIFATVGLTSIITKSDLFKKLRRCIKRKSYFYGKAIQCSRCMGFWSALFVYLLILLNFHILNYAFIGSLFSYIIAITIKKLKKL